MGPKSKRSATPSKTPKKGFDYLKDEKSTEVPRRLPPPSPPSSARSSARGGRTTSIVSPAGSAEHLVETPRRASTTLTPDTSTISTVARGKGQQHPQPKPSSMGIKPFVASDVMDTLFPTSIRPAAPVSTRGSSTNVSSSPSTTRRAATPKRKASSAITSTSTGIITTTESATTIGTNTEKKPFLIWESFEDFAPMKRFLTRSLLVGSLFLCLLLAMGISLEPFADHWISQLSKLSDQAARGGSVSAAGGAKGVSRPLLTDISSLRTMKELAPLLTPHTKKEGSAKCRACLVAQQKADAHRNMLKDFGFSSDDELLDYVRQAENSKDANELARLEYMMEILLIFQQRIDVVAERQGGSKLLTVSRWCSGVIETLLWPFVTFTSRLTDRHALSDQMCPSVHNIFWNAVSCLSGETLDLVCPSLEMQLYHQHGVYSDVVTHFLKSVEPPTRSECASCAEGRP